ncbi:hypothetical protein LY76DRAFT_596300 [Colletotrichum caudatum]|nr:hypothetical protein LY76DRAFT_596300 [Colletotrichum caudatum]
MLPRYVHLLTKVTEKLTETFLSSNSSVFEFETIQTTQFLAKPRYLEKCISAGPVLRFLEKSRYRKPIYIITGLKVVSGAKVKSLHSRSAGSEFNAEVDLTALGGGPVGIGPQIIARRGGTEEISWQGCNDFVFAFRVRKIMVAKKDASVKVDEDYKKGAMLDGELPCFQNPELVVLTEEEGDDDENFLTEETIEGGEAVLCAAFRPRADNPS